MSVPAELRYTQEHEWVAIDGGTATIGITDYATQALGDVVYVSLPQVGAAVTAGEPCGEVESTKSVSDLFSPLDGEVTEVNEELDDDPGLVNAEPYGAGWMFRVRFPGGATALPAGLLTAAQYEDLTKSAELSGAQTNPREARPGGTARCHRAVPGFRPSARAAWTEPERGRNDQAKRGKAARPRREARGTGFHPPGNLRSLRQTK